MAANCCCVNLQVEESPLIEFELDGGGFFDFSDGEYIPSSEFDTYDGAVEVTPSGETQVLATQDKVLITNITINPIPSNYGLITWNGSVLTVS